MNRIYEEYKAAMDLRKLREGLQKAMEVGRACNKFFQDEKPWELFKKG